MDDLLHFARVVLPAAVPVPRFSPTSLALEEGSSGRGGASAVSDTTRLPAVDTAPPGSSGSTNVAPPAVKRESTARGDVSAMPDTARLPAVDAVLGSGGNDIRGRWESDSRVTVAATGGIAGGAGGGGGGGIGDGDEGGGENVAMADRLDISVVAHSMGGLTALYAALEDPQLFKGVRGLLRAKTISLIYVAA